MRRTVEVCIAVIFLFLLMPDVLCRADTFTNRQTGEKFHGYATGQTEQGRTIVRSEEKGTLELNLMEWLVTPDRLGRNNKVIILTVDEDIEREIETDAFEKTIGTASAQGPLFILVEINTPGGRVNLVYRMCAAITEKANCEVIAYIKAGQYAGAVSGGAAVALACDKIYMAENTIIGGVAVVAVPKPKKHEQEVIYVGPAAEKISSIWRAYFASLAEQNKRPGLLARAMVDNKIEVIEVNESGQRMFIEPVNKKHSQQVVRTWSKNGSLLTLTSGEAVQCRIADGIISSRKQLLQQLQADNAEVVVDKSMQYARKKLKRVVNKVLQIRKSLDLRAKQAQTQDPQKALANLRRLRSEFETLIQLIKRYPDLHVNPTDIMELEDQLNSFKADYEEILRERKRRIRKRR